MKIFATWRSRCFLSASVRAAGCIDNAAPCAAIAGRHQGDATNRIGGGNAGEPRAVRRGVVVARTGFAGEEQAVVEGLRQNCARIGVAGQCV
jgi:hypothetical protein